MYPNLKAEFVRRDLTLEKVAPELGITVSTLSLKMNGKYQFTFNEAKKLKAILNEVSPLDMSLEVLFEEAS